KLEILPDCAYALQSYKGYWLGLRPGGQLTTNSTVIEEINKFRLHPADFRPLPGAPHGPSGGVTVSGGGRLVPPDKTVEVNVDRPGRDYTSFDLPAGSDFSACYWACNDDTQCRAWTYVNPGVQGPQPRCWLKSEIPGAVASNCCVSGIR